DETRRPVTSSSEPRKWNCVVGVTARASASTGKFDVSRCDIELRGRRARELRLDLFSGKMRDAANRGGETAGVITGRNRPCVLCGVELGDHANVGRLKAESVGDNLRQHRAMALTLRHRGNLH